MFVLFAIADNVFIWYRWLADNPSCVIDPWPCIHPSMHWICFILFLHIRYKVCYTSIQQKCNTFWTYWLNTLRSNYATWEISALRFYLQACGRMFSTAQHQIFYKETLTYSHVISHRYWKPQFLNHSWVTLVTLFTQLKSYKLELEPNSLGEMPSVWPIQPPPASVFILLQCQ